VLTLAALLAGVARASDGVIKIGVLNDQTGIYADFGGAGSVVAARMAAEDMGGSVLGKSIEVVFGDHQNKPDIGVAIARQWFDVDHVDMIVDLSNSAVALAVETVAKERNRIVIATAVGTPDFTGKDCTPTEASWLHDSYALSTSVARAYVAKGLDTWFFITVDYSFGHSLEADARRAIDAAGGKVVGGVRHPLNTADFSSYLVQARGSRSRMQPAT
jgi:branched-chain amino acid transport system substrate-binding protein